MLEEAERRGLLSRFFPRASQAASPTVPEAPSPSDWADNNQRPVHSLVTKVLRASDCLIVTGYQDFLSSLAYLIDTVGGIGDGPAGSIRMVFGTNTCGFREIGAAISRDRGRLFHGIAGSHFAVAGRLIDGFMGSGVRAKVKGFRGFSAHAFA